MLILVLFLSILLSDGIAKTNLSAKASEDILSHVHNGVDFKPWTKTDCMPNEAGNYYLTNDVTLLSKWVPSAGETNLCLDGHHIRSINSNENEPVIHLAEGCFSTLSLYDKENNSGTVSGGCSGVTIDAGIFIMNGGTICHNYTLHAGGGVVVNANGSFTMNGGKITENAAGAYSGGVNVSSGTFKISGSPIIKNNTVDNRENNLYLHKNFPKIEIIDTLNQDALIGVHADAAKTITSGLNGKGSAANFFSDLSDYHIATTDNGEACLQERIPGEFTNLDSIIIPATPEPESQHSVATVEQDKTNPPNSEKSPATGDDLSTVLCFLILAGLGLFASVAGKKCKMTTE